jgi:hypothetical protein
VSVHTPVHSTNPAAHTHAPLAHTAPRAQRTPQAPQFWGSLFVLTQAPAQLTVSPAHELEHVDALHT